MKLKFNCIFYVFYLAIVNLFTPLVSTAQTFTQIVGHYSCAQFNDGLQLLVKGSANSFSLVSTKEVTKEYKSELKILKNKIKLLDPLLKDFENSRISKTKLIGQANSIFSKLFGGDSSKMTKDFPPDAAELRILDYKQRALQRQQLLVALNDLLENCESGVSPKTGKAKPLAVSVSPISAASSREIYGGFLIYAPKMKNKFSKVPTGYNVCLKLIYPDGTIGKLYTGFGDDELCGTGTGTFEGVSPLACDALLQKGQAGYVIQKRIYNFTSLPDATSEQLLERMKTEVVQDQPVVGVLVFPVDLSRDVSVKICDVF